MYVCVSLIKCCCSCIHPTAGRVEHTTSLIMNINDSVTCRAGWRMMLAAQNGLVYFSILMRGRGWWQCFFVAAADNYDPLSNNWHGAIEAEALLQRTTKAKSRLYIWVNARIQLPMDKSWRSTQQYMTSYVHTRICVFVCNLNVDTIEQHGWLVVDILLFQLFFNK